MRVCLLYACIQRCHIIAFNKYYHAYVANNIYASFTPLAARERRACDVAKLGCVIIGDFSCTSSLAVRFKTSSRLNKKRRENGYTVQFILPSDVFRHD